MDDVADVLLEFNDQTPVAQSQNQPGSSGRPRHNTRVDASIPSLSKASNGLGATDEADEDTLTTAFAQELAKEMENLMREISDIDPSTLAGRSTEANTDGEGEIVPEKVKEAEQALKAAWEAMLVEGMNGMAGTDGDRLANLGEILGDPGLGPKKDGAKMEASNSGKAGESASQGATEKKKNDFQDALKQAMNKMKETESNLQVSSFRLGTGCTFLSLPPRCRRVRFPKGRERRLRT